MTTHNNREGIWEQIKDITSKCWDRDWDPDAYGEREAKQRFEELLHQELQKAREEEREKFKMAFDKELENNVGNLPYWRYIARWKTELFDQSELAQPITKDNLK